jgi:hypothetical protein
MPHTPPLGHGALPTPHLRRPPHPSGTKPHDSPAHAVVAFAGVQVTPPPQTLGVPPPPQTLGAVHVPQSVVSPPHPSATWPQFFPSWMHVIGVHVPPSAPSTDPPPQTLAWPPPPQIWGEVQPAPHETTPPQPSATEPQFIPAGHCVTVGVHGGVPHWPATPAPPQTWPVGQVVAHVRMPPQPSAMSPHAPAGHVFFTHVPPSAPTTLPPPQTLGVPPPPQTWGGTQPPQAAVVFPHPSGWGPQRPG